MGLEHRLRSTGHRLVERLGPEANEPTTAATVVGTASVAFSLPYYGYLMMGHAGSVMVGNWDPVVVLAGLFVLTVANAVAVSWLVWDLVGFSGVWSYRRGAVAGLGIGVVSHVTLAALLTGIGVLSEAATGGALLSSSLQGLPAQFLIVALFSVLLTAGIPIVLSVGAGIGLTYCRKQVT